MLLPNVCLLESFKFVLWLNVRFSLSLYLLVNDILLLSVGIFTGILDLMLRNEDLQDVLDVMSFVWLSSDFNLDSALVSICKLSNESGREIVLLSGQDSLHVFSETSLVAFWSRDAFDSAMINVSVSKCLSEQILLAGDVEKDTSCEFRTRVGTFTNS